MNVKTPLSQQEIFGVFFLFFLTSDDDYRTRRRRKDQTNGGEVEESLSHGWALQQGGQVQRRSGAAACRTAAGEAPKWLPSARVEAWEIAPSAAPDAAANRWAGGPAAHF